MPARDEEEGVFPAGPSLALWLRMEPWPAPGTPPVDSEWPMLVLAEELREKAPPEVEEGTGEGS